MNRKEHTLCWNCRNFCGGCEWSKDFDPVPGWVAKKVPLRNKTYNLKGGRNNYDRNPSLDKDSYMVLHCPKFRKG